MAARNFFLGYRHVDMQPHEVLLRVGGVFGPGAREFSTAGPDASTMAVQHIPSCISCDSLEWTRGLLHSANNIPFYLAP